MFKTQPTLAYILTAIILLLSFAASAGGIFVGDLYRDTAFSEAAWFGNDLITLVIAVPLLVGTLIFSIRGSGLAQLIWLGMLDYTLYNYAFYLFGTAFNLFFLIYVGIFALSILALIFALPKVDINRLKAVFETRLPSRGISLYMLFVAAGLGGVEITQWANFILKQQLPMVIENTTPATHVIVALDLSLVVPYFLLGAIWLWQKKPWGFMIATIMNVKGTIYMMALTAATASITQAGFTEAAAELPIWIFLQLSSLIASVILLRSFQASNRISDKS